MFSFAKLNCLLSNTPPLHVTRTLVRRWKTKKARRKPHTSLALDHFDTLYKDVYRERWHSIRLALFCAEKKCLVVNNFGDRERVVADLRKQGAINIRDIFIEEQSSLDLKKDVNVEKVYTVGEDLKKLLIKQAEDEISTLFPPESETSAQTLSGVTEQIRHVEKFNSLKDDDFNDCNVDRTKVAEDPTIDTPLTQSLLEAEYDMSRLIVPTKAGISLGASLYEFVPSTRLKGMEDYVTESSQFSSYGISENFPIQVESEDRIAFPSFLDVYAFERGNCEEFLSPALSSTGVFDYFECNLSLLCPVLALGLEREDKVLDMLAGNGSSSVLILQTLIPKILISNEPKRRLWEALNKTIRDQNFNFESESSHVYITGFQPLEFQSACNKILLTVPSSYDRKSVTVEENNVFHPTYVRDRLTLPELQAQYLSRALELVEDGGTVVYCTNSLSPVQNDGVVVMALQDMWTRNNCKFIIKDMSRAFVALKPFIEVVNGGRFGHLVLPFLPSNCGPLYFCKLVKTHHEIPE